MKKLVATLLAAAMAMSLLTGCSGGNSGGNETASTTAATTAAAKEETTVAAAETTAAETEAETPDPDTIAVMVPPVTGDYPELMEKWIAEYTADHPWITVDLTNTSWNENPDKISTMALSGEAPDIVMNDFKMLGTLVEMGVAVNVADYMDPEALADYDQNALDYLTLEGTLYALPLYMTIQALGGNKAMMEAAGADVEKIQTEGWTWDEFLEIIKNGTVKDQTWGLTFASAGSSTKDFVNIFGVAAGINNDFTPSLKYAYTSENMKNLLSTVETLVSSGYMPNYGVEAGQRLVMLQTGQTMVTGKAMPLFESNVKNNIAALADGSALEGTVEDLEYVFLPVPTLENVQPACYGIVDCLIPCRNQNSTDEHLKNVCDFLNFLTSGERIAEVANQVYLPAVCESGRKAQEGTVLDQSDANAAASERCLGLVIAPPTGVTTEQSANADTIMTEVIVPKFQALIAGETTADDMYQAICDAAFAAFGEDGCETGFFTY